MDFKLLKMILKIFLALIFTNIFGILYDYLEGINNRMKRKFYFDSIPQIIYILFFRNVVYVLSFLNFKKKNIFNSLSIIIFIISIYFLLEIRIEYHIKLSVLYGLSLILWAIIYSYLAISTKFLYEGNISQGKELTGRELRIFSDTASVQDKFIIFFTSLVLSLFSKNIYIISIITVFYIYVVVKIIY